VTHDEMIEVIQAHKEGKEIQCRLKDPSLDEMGWLTKGGDTFNFTDYIYRIKPEPKEIWVNEHRQAVDIGYSSREEAVNHAYWDAERVAVHYKEVIE